MRDDTRAPLEAIIRGEYGPRIVSLRVAAEYAYDILAVGRRTSFRRFAGADGSRFEIYADDDARKVR